MPPRIFCTMSIMLMHMFMCGACRRAAFRPDRRPNASSRLVRSEAFELPSPCSLPAAGEDALDSCEGSYLWLANTRVAPLVSNAITSYGSAFAPGISIPGEPTGIPPTANPAIGGRSFSSRCTSDAGT
jgi:hypothetical protein